MLSKDTSTQTLVPAGIYRHYKGQRYQVLYCARHSETEEWQVVYRCLYGEFSLWVRPLAMFIESVSLENGLAVPRFALEIATEFTSPDLNRL
ncbi:hypothetical protein BKE30_06690 [Alkanindiges hydrocarboniclasticus]|jgi:hypothetical protein|uniref:DUF1653 domain-containing protein n=1 Tax=Alkanindiges hydrocarboniclasticus TaxID=1907941 RepID=A0A1S8CWG2_9GAMM|nr:DUF1653 domain-containing protein [Alkanindiges hydrocarboniclasticus]ONG40829.1 hypothetical protein BKE30_06690 [Alkanindiges hydrocarboniclasticus]